MANKRPSAATHPSYSHLATFTTAGMLRFTHQSLWADRINSRQNEVFAETSMWVPFEGRANVNKQLKN